LEATDLRSEVPLPMEYINWHINKRSKHLSSDVEKEDVASSSTWNCAVQNLWSFQHQNQRTHPVLSHKAQTYPWPHIQTSLLTYYWKIRKYLD